MHFNGIEIESLMGRFILLNAVKPDSHAAGSDGRYMQRVPRLAAHPYFIEITMPIRGLTYTALSVYRTAQSLDQSAGSGSLNSPT